MHKSLICDECGTYVEMLFTRSRVKCGGCGKLFSHSGKEKGEKVSTLPQGQAGIRLIKIEGAGLGVEAGQHFDTGDLIERCPAFRVNPNFQEILLNGPCEVTGYTRGGDVQFAKMLLPDPGNVSASGVVLKRTFVVALGFGMLYNHSDKAPNAYIRLHTDADDGRLYIDFFAYKPISAGEQILINYHNLMLKQEVNTSKMGKWFSSVDLSTPEPEPNTSEKRSS